MPATSFAATISRRVPRPSCSRRCTTCSHRRSWRRGSWRIGCRCGCSCRRTSSSGVPTPGAYRATLPRAVLLLSGGLDSYTAGAIARRDGYDLYALTVRYGQVHAREIAAARDVAASLSVTRHVELDVDLTAFGGSALLGDGEIPKDRELDAAGVPSTYVPARNTIFLSLALGWAEVLGAEAIVLGVNALDYSGYPDCRPEYLEAFERLPRPPTPAGGGGRPPEKLSPPLPL